MTVSGTQPPIADYGLISDMHSCALISRAGSIDWCCFPRFDGAAVFARILDWERGGYFQLAPQGVRAVRRRYLPATNVLSVFCSAPMRELPGDGFRAQGELAAGERVTAAVTYQSRFTANPSELSEQDMRRAAGG